MRHSVPRWLLFALTIPTLAMLAPTQNASAEGTAYLARTEGLDFTRQMRNRCFERIIWLKPGWYEFEQFVDRWAQSRRSAWKRGAKRARKKINVPRPGNYTWRNCFVYSSPKGGIRLPGAREWSRSYLSISTDLVELDLTPPVWSLNGRDRTASWGTDDADGVYHFGSSLHWVP